jgi:hypothetical protein
MIVNAIPDVLAPRKMQLIFQRHSSSYLEPMKQRWKVITGIIAGFAVVLLIIWTSPVGRFILSGGLTTEEQPFDAQLWKSVEDQDQSKMRIRLLMVDDLMENHLKTGMDSSAVKEMLGEPERKYGFSYGLGMLTPGMDPLYMILSFDTNGKIDNMDVETEGELKEEKSDAGRK